jgi:hypothetical protein
MAVGVLDALQSMGIQVPEQTTSSIPAATL